VCAANVAQQYLKAGLLDEIQVHLVPVLLGGGVRLFDHTGNEQIELERTRVIESTGVTPLRFCVVKKPVVVQGMLRVLADGIMPGR
jgi:dihydrofolate reductase